MEFSEQTEGAKIVPSFDALTEINPPGPEQLDFSGLELTSLEALSQAVEKLKALGVRPNLPGSISKVERARHQDIGLSFRIKPTAEDVDSFRDSEKSQRDDHFEHAGPMKSGADSIEDALTLYAEITGKPLDGSKFSKIEPGEEYDHPFMYGPGSFKKVNVTYGGVNFNLSSADDLSYDRDGRPTVVPESLIEGKGGSHHLYHSRLEINLADSELSSGHAASMEQRISSINQRIEASLESLKKVRFYSEFVRAGSDWDNFYRSEDERNQATWRTPID